MLHTASSAARAGAAGACSTSGRATPPRPSVQQQQHRRSRAQRQQQLVLPPTQGVAAAAAARQPHRSSRLAAASSSSPVAAAAASSSTEVAELKQRLRQSIEGLDRGIFGVQAAKRQEVADIVAALEGHNPTPNPTQHLADLVDGCWSLLYTTVTITGVRKTKLGLREFVKLGDFHQIIDTQQKEALNVIYFRVAGLGLFNGNLSIKASYEVESEQRVSIKFVESTLVPDQLRQLFEKNYELLLSIFNPEGWLDITYVDSELRVGRDDKGNLFVLERTQQPPATGSS